MPSPKLTAALVTFGTMTAFALFAAWQLLGGEVRVFDEEKRGLVSSVVQSQIDSSLLLINPTFLGNNHRNYYGSDAPDKLEVIWKFNLGRGKTWINSKKQVSWAGAGWTGQPLLVVEDGKPYLIQGAYDHHLRKIDATTGEEIWRYKYDDVIKSTGTLWLNPNPKGTEDKLLILQGSRSGTLNRKKPAFSYRAVSYLTGKEMWRLNSKATASYSRDVDASALILDTTAVIGLENGLLVFFDPDPAKAISHDSFRSPKILRQTDTLFTKKDARSHGGNVVTESSPILLGDRIYLASGSGYVFGFHLGKNEIDWVYYTGSDLDGTPAVTTDGCLLVPVEKQYIKGKGGLLKLNPSKPPEESVEWFCPSRDRTMGSWKGGVIGSVTISNENGWAAFAGIDGVLRVVDYKALSVESVKLFDGKQDIPSPKEVFNYKIGPSISTPVFVGNRLVAAGYGGVFIFEFDEKGHFKLLAKRKGFFEATPFVYQNRIYIASRNGYLYCFGDNPDEEAEALEPVVVSPPKTTPKPKISKPKLSPKTKPSAIIKKPAPKPSPKTKSSAVIKKPAPKASAKTSASTSTQKSIPKQVAKSTAKATPATPKSAPKTTVKPPTR